MKWKKENNGWGIDLEKMRFMFVKKSYLTEDHTWKWRWAVADAVGSGGDGDARTKAEAQRCAVAVATALGWVKP